MDPEAMDPEAMDPEARDVAARLREVVERHGGVRLALLFGSVAKGRSRPGGDVDVGLVPSDADASLSFELALQAALERAVGRPVDLVRLDRANVLVRWQAARDGLLIWQAGPHDAARFRAEAAIAHAEMRPLLDRAAEAYRRRLAREAGPALESP